MIKLSFNMPTSYTEQDLLKKVQKTLKIDEKYIKNVQILKKSIDARKKSNIVYCLTVGAEVDENIEKTLSFEKIIVDYSGLSFEKLNLNKRPLVVGFGPSGMFCALSLAKMGAKPIVIEQGSCVEKRLEQVKEFWQLGKLNKFSNVQFGEGGAGTFSDGKLNTNLNNEYCKKVINELYLHGAPQQILYDSKPHIGSDKLPEIVKNIREEIISLGGTVLFDTKLLDINIINNKVASVKIFDLATNKTSVIKTDIVCLCVGHSARDVFELLYKKGQKINQKPFAIGVRIEQKAQNVNVMQYGKDYDNNLPNADYKLVAHLDNGRSMFTFCMCPGGSVVASSSDDGEIVTNGMSCFARDSEYSNSALLINVEPNDYQSDHPLAGIYFQQKYERLAYELGGGDFCAPVQSVGSFLDGKQNMGRCSYMPKYKFTEIQKCLPSFVTQSLKLGLKQFNKKYNFS
ncbi:MAG: hypothetical protein J6T39_03050, partial [Clostridia bacterium]|nr:hypothetical protein [Clostridia bacterium]